MTTPTTTVPGATEYPWDDAFEKQLEGIYHACLNQKMARAARRQQMPVTILYDGDYNARGRVAGEYDSKFTWRINEAGTATITLPEAHHLAVWALDVHGRKTENIHVIMDRDGSQWAGRMTGVEYSFLDDGTRVIVLDFLHDLAELDHVRCWPNPFSPAAAQFPKSFVLAGPAITTLKMTLALNLYRLHGNLWQVADNPLDPVSWLEGVLPWDWTVVVEPGSIIGDSSQWCIISSRMKSFMELARPILADAGLMITTRRWLPGQPKPKGWLAPMKPGQLIVDIVDKSGVFEGTATGGTIFGGMLRTATKLADNVIDDLVTVIASPAEPAEYTVSKWLGTAPRQPWVVFRDGQYTAIRSGKYRREPATAVTITGGGKSAPGVNETISMTVQLVGNMIGAVFFLDTLGSIADTALAPLYEDVFLAFGSVKSPIRAMRLGKHHYLEDWAQGMETAWALSGVVGFRQRFWETRSRESYTIQVGDGGPYLLGAPGRGHFWLGDRIGVELKPVRGRIVVEQVQEITLAWSRDAAPGYDLTVGDPRTGQAPIARLLDQSRLFFEAWKDLGVSK